MTHNEANFYLLNDDMSSLHNNFGEALEEFPYVIPQIRKFAWPQVLDRLPVWSRILL
jgi:hypothetical protein